MPPLTGVSNCEGEQGPRPPMASMPAITIGAPHSSINPSPKCPRPLLLLR
ncbi:unnamed protein product [Spirodela intermedia]|uniref:Uncharacterized protein n=1 Tax=Spirodela intermedia TaxID=51605 RepID=A0A7I8JS86_SPIIN|nr:unnamed protein product [Spirodela intermedia]CAA6673040.1 unnamed protein product [Spirodela intermedia]